MKPPISKHAEKRMQDAGAQMLCKSGVAMTANAKDVQIVSSYPIILRAVAVLAKCDTRRRTVATDFPSIIYLGLACV